MSENYMFFQEILKNDKLNFEADPAIEQRLMYHFQLKASSSKIKRNSLLPFLETIFSTRFISLKIGFVALIIFIAFGMKQFKAPKEMNLHADTASAFRVHDTLCSLSSVDSIALN
jgi:hypothetical protein